MPPQPVEAPAVDGQAVRRAWLRVSWLAAGGTGERAMSAERTCLGHGCTTVFVRTWRQPRQEFCSQGCARRMQHCPCLRCADVRAATGCLPLSIRIGRFVTPALPPERRAQEGVA